MAADAYLVLASTGSIQGTYLDAGKADAIARQVGGVVAPVAITADYRTPPAPPVGTFWVHTNTGPISDDVLQREALRRRYVVLNAWDHAKARKLKGFNPALKVFVYKCVSSTRDYDSNRDWWMLPAGVSYQQADTKAPDWFLKNASSGRRIQWSYPGHWQMDVGNVEYQNVWATNVQVMTNYGFDGIWMDNLLWRRADYQAYPSKYATDEAFRAAYLSFLRNVTPKLKAAGLLCFGNLNGARLITGGWQSYLDAGLDGGFDEFWLSVDNTGNNLLPEYTQGWSRLVDEIAYAEAQGKAALVQPHFPADNTRAFGYTFASYLMAAGKRSAFTEANGTDTYDAATAWHPEYDRHLGAPLGARYRPANATNIWRRDFERGIAVVNCNKTGSPLVTVQLGGSYRDDHGGDISAVALPGTSGAVLRSTT